PAAAAAPAVLGGAADLVAAVRGRLAADPHARRGAGVRDHDGGGRGGARDRAGAAAGRGGGAGRAGVAARPGGGDVGRGTAGAAAAAGVAAGGRGAVQRHDRDRALQRGDRGDGDRLLLADQRGGRVRAGGGGGRGRGAGRGLAGRRAPGLPRAGAAAGGAVAADPVHQLRGGAAAARLGRAGRADDRFLSGRAGDGPRRRVRPAGGVGVLAGGRDPGDGGGVRADRAAAARPVR